jgi:AraC-like DNA-binding protein
MNNPAQSKLLVAAYRGAPSGQRYEMWREELCRGFCRMDIEPSEHDHIDCQTTYTSISSVALARPTGLSGRFMRTHEVLSDGHDDLLLFSAIRGRVQIEQGRSSVSLSQGQMCLAEMNTFCAVELHNTNEFTATRIPRRSVLQLAPRAEDKLCRPLAHDRALQTMLERYTELCMNVAPSLDAVGQQRAAQHLVDMTGLLLGSGGDIAELPTQRGYSAARLDLIKADVLKNLDRTQLTIDAIARDHNLSPRQVQRLFAHSGATFTEFVLEQRLSLAYRLLSDPGCFHRKVSDIAYSSGFGDLSYFNREFRRRFGDTPNGIRAERMGTDPTNMTAIWLDGKLDRSQQSFPGNGRVKPEQVWTSRPPRGSDTKKGRVS